MKDAIATDRNKFSKFIDWLASIMPNLVSSRVESIAKASARYTMRNYINHSLTGGLIAK